MKTPSKCKHHIPYLNCWSDQGKDRVLWQEGNKPELIWYTIIPLLCKDLRDAKIWEKPEWKHDSDITYVEA